MAKYLVTGGAGFIGSNIVDALVEAGEEVRVLDNFSTGKRDNIEHLRGKIDMIEGDLRYPDDVARSVDGVDFVLHQGAIPSVPRSVADPVLSNETNITGTLNVLIAARDAKIKRVVFASSSSVYGDTPTLPKKEDMVPNPLSPYATNKITGEYYMKNFQQLFGLQTVCLRYFNVFGPRQDPKSKYAAVIPIFIESLKNRKSPMIFGDGLQSRDFSYVKNAVSANIKACHAPDSATAKVYNIACGERYTLLELLACLNEIMGTNIEPVHDQSRKGDVKHSLADISAARENLGYEPETDFVGQLKLTVDWFTRAG